MKLLGVVDDILIYDSNFLELFCGLGRWGSKSSDRGSSHNVLHDLLCQGSSLVH